MGGSLVDQKLNIDESFNWDLLTFFDSWNISNDFYYIDSLLPIRFCEKNERRIFKLCPLLPIRPITS